MADPKTQVNDLKNEANKLFSEHKYKPAIELYSKAIDLDPSNAVLFSNRAFCHIRLEDFGLAREDSEKAIQIDPTYAKAFYRRASAYFALGKYNESLKDFRQVAKMCPGDKGVAERILETDKIIKRIAFEEAISVDVDHKSPFDDLGLEAMEVESSYDGVHLPQQITQEFVLGMIAMFKKQKILHKKYALQILLWIRQILQKQPSLVEIQLDAAKNQKITVCGDVHGQFYDLVNIFELNGYPQENHLYLFNGDFVDRGSFSVEVIFTLFAFKALYPNSFFLARGNHESKAMNKIYGFEGEIRKKYSEKMYDMFCELFCLLPLAHTINNKVLVVHGGLFSKDGVTLDDIKKINRNREPPDEGLMCELLWSDPSPIPGRRSSKRGVGVAFGPDVTEAFLAQNNLDLLIRSHEVKDEGYAIEANGKLITVFSAPNYCDQVGNKGAYINFDSNMNREIKSFSHVPHPNLPPMAYSSGMGMNLFGY